MTWIQSRRGGAWAPAGFKARPESSVGPVWGTQVVDPGPPESQIIDIGTYGIVNNASDQQALLNTIFASTTLHPIDKWLRVPLGWNIRHSDKIILSRPGFKLLGPGKFSALVRDPAGIGVIANDCTIDGITHENIDPNTGRTSGVHNNLIRARDCSGVTIKNCLSLGSSGTGYMFQNVSNYLLDNCTTRDSYADGIHQTIGSNNGVVSNCTSEWTRTSRGTVSATSTALGDDMVAVVSYEKHGLVAGMCHDITVIGCVGRNNSHGRGFTVVGGRDVTYDGFLIEDCNAAGILVSAEDAFATMGCTNVTFRNGTMNRCSDVTSMGAVFVINSRNSTSGWAIDNLRIEDVIINDTDLRTNRVVRIASDPPAGVTFTTAGPVTRNYMKNIQLNGIQPADFWQSAQSDGSQLPAANYRNTNWTRNGVAISTVDVPTGTYVPVPA